MLRSLRLVVLAVAVLTVAVLTTASLTAAVGAAATAGPPRMWPFDHQLRRGGGTSVFGASLEPNTSYQLAADSGGFFQEGTSNAITQVTTDDAGMFRASFHMALDLPAAVTAVGLTATPPDNATVTATITVAAPLLEAGPRGRACATVTGDFVLDGLPPGDYVVSSPKITLPTTPITVSNARLAFSGSFAADLPTTTTITATAQDGSNTTYAFDVARSHPFIAADQLGPTPWRAFYVADCFTPGETVSFASSDPHTIASRPVKADSAGRAHFVVDTVNTATVLTVQGVTATGASSGQTALTGPRRTFATTLPAGASLSPTSGTLLIASPHRNYTADVSYCDLETRWNPWPDGGSAPAWSARGKRSTVDTCQVTLRTDGNLVLHTPNGTVLWSTQTQGTGAHNRLIIQDDGNLVIRNAVNHLVWTSRTGIVRTPRAMGAGQTLTLGQSLVNGATRFTLRRSGNLAVTRNGRTLWTSHTAYRGAVKLTLLTSGLLRLTNRAGRTIWSDHQYGPPYDHLIVQSNGDVQVRSAAGTLMWHTRTAG